MTCRNTSSNQWQIYNPRNTTSHVFEDVVVSIFNYFTERLSNLCSICLASGDNTMQPQYCKKYQQGLLLLLLVIEEHHKGEDYVNQIIIHILIVLPKLINYETDDDGFATPNCNFIFQFLLW